VFYSWRGCLGVDIVIAVIPTGIQTESVTARPDTHRRPFDFRLHFADEILEDFNFIDFSGETTFEVCLDVDGL
jgi:hypothetical protein